jgi:hypothetical protein
VARKLGFLVVVGLAASAAGCGSGRLSKAAYEKKVAAAWVDVRRNEIAWYKTTGCSKQACPAVSSRSALSQLEALPVDLRKVADELSKLAPPGDAKSDNDKLVAGLRDIANEVGVIEKAAKTGNALVEYHAFSKLQSSRGVREIAEAFSDLKSKGYSNFG